MDDKKRVEKKDERVNVFIEARPKAHAAVRRK